MAMATASARGHLLVLFSALMFGSYGVWSRLIGPSFGVFYQGWSRAFIIAIILLPVLYYSKQITRIKRADWGWLALFLLFTSLTQAPLFYAFNHMSIGTATLLFFVSMLLTMYAVGFVFLKEKLTVVKGSAFLVAVFGLYLTFSFSITVFAVFAACMAILNGIASGGEVSFSKKLSGSYSALYLSWLSWVAIVVTNGIASLALHEVQPVPTFTLSWVYIVGYAAASVLGFWCIIEGLKYVEASIGGLLGLLEIVFSISFGILIFHEKLTANTLVGGFLILLAAALPYLVDLLKPPSNARVA